MRFILLAMSRFVFSPFSLSLSSSPSLSLPSISGMAKDRENREDPS